MANQEFVVESNRTTAVLEQLTQEIEQTPQEYLPNLLQLVRLFRQSVTLKIDMGVLLRCRCDRFKLSTLISCTTIYV